MTQIYKPEIEEDDGYSIPKIVGAILFLVLVGAGVYIYFQQKKLKTSVSYLLDSKKQAEQDLNQMIERYNLAIDDNSSLETDLRDERDQIIRYRDSIRNIESKDFKEVASVKETVLKLQEASAIQFANSGASSIENTTLQIAEEEDFPVVAETTKSESNDKSKTVTVLETIEDTTTDISNNNSPFNNMEELLDSFSTNPILDNEVSEPALVEKSSVELKKEASTTFNRVEIPPTYPGCEGTAYEKKICFAKKVKRHLTRRFDTSIVDNLNMESGTQRVWVHFYIDKNGYVTNIKARGPHDKLEEEAVRVIKSLPKMTSAIQNGKSVQINYSVPITIKIP